MSLCNALISIYISVRFENEEQEVKKFVDFMKSKKPDAFSEFEVKTLEEILIVLKETSVLWSPSPKSDNLCHCECEKPTNITLAKIRHRREMANSARYSEHMQTIRTSIDAYDAVKQRTRYALKKYLTRSIPSFSKVREINAQREQDVTLHLQRTAIPAKHFVEISGSGVHSDANINSEKDNKHSIQNYPKNVEAKPLNDNDQSKNKRSTRRRRRAVVSNKKSHTEASHDVFVFTVNLDQENFYLVSQFKELSNAKISMSHLEDEITKTSYYQQYERVHDLSLGIKYAGFGILTLMLAEVSDLA